MDKYTHGGTVERVNSADLGGMSDRGDEEWCSGWGRWQARLALLLALPVLLTGAYGTNYVFLAAPAPFRCQVPECEGEVSQQPARPGDDTWSPAWRAWALGAERCSRWKPVDGGCGPASFDNSTSVACDRFVYQESSSIVVEFGLACQEWRRSLVGTVHNVGMLVSLPILGFFSDKWGRRAALAVSACGAGLLGLLKSFVNSYYMYLGGEFLETIFGASVYPAAFVLMIEWLGVRHRIQTSLVLGVPLALGSAGLSLLDYLTGYWRLWARVAYPPSFLLLLYPWLLPESVRWLLTRGRISEAMETIKKAAKYNKVEISEESLSKMVMQQKQQAEGDEKEDKESLMQALIQYGALRRRLAVCGVWWFSAVFVLYGLAVNTYSLGGSLHVNYALLAAVQVPALLANTLLLDRVGRRPLLTGALLLTSVSLIASSCSPDSIRWMGTAWFLAGEVGATMTLNALYVYTVELFPTRARHRLLAACSALGRLGAILAPLTPLLAQHKPWLPTVIFGSLPLLSAALTRLVPDTLACPLPSSFAELAQPPLQKVQVVSTIS